MTDESFARALWRRLESIHAVTYFAPESVEAAMAIGLQGFWRTYFGFRAAPLGACSAGPVIASFYGFAPSMVERAIPSIWTMATPAELLQARVSSAAAALRRLAGPELEAGLADGRLLDALRAAALSGSPGGRPLYAANRGLEPPDDPVGLLWQLATTLREHRGDGHVAAWTAQGFAPLEVAVLFVADGGTSRDSLQPNRGWTDDEWADAAAQLERDGLLDRGRATEGGRAVRAAVESTTDRLADAPFATLGDRQRRELLDRLEPLAMAIGDSATIPASNPMGLRLVNKIT